MMLRDAIIITHIPEEQVAYRQCTRPSLPPAKAWLREARGVPEERFSEELRIDLKRSGSMSEPAGHMHRHVV